MKSKVKKALLKLLQIAVKLVPTNLFCTAVHAATLAKANSLPPVEGAALVLALDNALYGIAGNQAIRYGNGVHTKHRHIQFHNFFTGNIAAGSSVLDVGCGYGALANSLSTIEGSSIYGFDIEPKNIEKAKKLFSKPNVHFIEGDVYKDLPQQHFDVVVMSNVLEHLPKRPEALQQVVRTVSPTKVLIRVPRFDRDWRVPLKKELGLEWRLDTTHFTEYTEDELRADLAAGGLHVEQMGSAWGEFWCVCTPKK